MQLPVDDRQLDSCVELYNHGVSDVDASGFRITDSDPSHELVLPAGTTVPRAATC